MQWVIELSQFDIEYKPGTAIKAHVVADFIAKFTMPRHEENQKEPIEWTIHTDESSTQKKGGACVVIITLERDTLKYGVQLQFPVTNNEARYEAILTRLRVAKALGAKITLLKSDSKLVIGQVNGEFKAKEKRMQRYLKLTNQLINEFDQVSFTQMPRYQNSAVDEVARYVSSKAKTGLTDLKLEV